MRVLYLCHSAPLGPFSEACLTLSPNLAVYPQSLFVDLGATAKAWKGESRQLEVFRGLEDLFQIRPKVVVCDRAAWAPAFAVADTTVLAPEESAARLPQLNIERLALLGDPQETEKQWDERQALVAFMHRVGMTTIGDFLRLSPAAILRRFGKLGGRLLDWATGQRDLILPTWSPDDPLAEGIDAEEVTARDQLLFLARQKLLQMECRLTGRGLLAQEVRLTFRFDSSPALSRTLRLAEPLRETPALLRLLEDFLSNLTWDSPLTHLEVAIPATVPHRSGQLSLFDDSLTLMSDLGHYVSRLRARLGEPHVGFAELKESHLPERSFATAWPPREPTLPRGDFPQRPLFIFDPPRAFQPSRGVRLEPTESLATHWWDGVGDRHYFIHHSPRGAQWVFWDGQLKQWFLHGLFE